MFAAFPSSLCHQAISGFALSASGSHQTNLGEFFRFPLQCYRPLALNISADDAHLNLVNRHFEPPLVTNPPAQGQGFYPAQPPPGFQPAYNPQQPPHQPGYQPQYGPPPGQYKPS